MGLALLLTPAAAWPQIRFQPLQPQPQPQQQPQPPNPGNPPSSRQVSTGSRAILRALDKISGAVEDLDMGIGETRAYGHLSVQLIGCRFPTEDPASDAYAFLDIFDTIRHERLFRGWMIASSPALNALDDPRYDVWVLRCA